MNDSSDSENDALGAKPVPRPAPQEVYARAKSLSEHLASNQPITITRRGKIVGVLNQPILVTGAAGTVGHLLCMRLAGMGLRVRAVDAGVAGVGC